MLSVSSSVMAGQVNGVLDSALLPMTAAATQLSCLKPAANALGTPGSAPAPFHTYAKARAHSLALRKYGALVHIEAVMMPATLAKAFNLTFSLHQRNLYVDTGCAEVPTVLQTPLVSVLNAVRSARLVLAVLPFWFGLEDTPGYA